MITSFGNEESEESESDTNDKELPDSKPKIVHHRKPSEYSSREKKTELKSVSKQMEIGPSLPPEMQEKISEKNSFSMAIESFLSSKSLTDNDPSINLESNGSEEDILRRLKNQAKLLQSMEKNTNSNESSSRDGSPFDSESDKQNKINESEKRLEEKPQSRKELKVSLVPGYEDDSENEEEIPPATEVKPLFPIAEYQSDKPVSSTTGDGILKKVETRQTETGCIRIFEYRNVEAEKTDTTNTEAKELNKETESSNNSELESRVSQPAQDLVKVNKFLENLETSAKAFQRKKRIAFDG